MTCPRCRVENIAGSSFCDRCGGKLAAAFTTYNAPYPAPAYGALAPSAPTALARFGQLFGIHPVVAVAMVSVDCMLFAEEAATLGIGWIISVPVAMVLALATFLLQKNLYDDDTEVAVGKALIVGLLTAIPTALPDILMIPSGIVGLIKTLKSR